MYPQDQTTLTEFNFFLGYTLSSTRKIERKDQDCDLGSKSFFFITSDRRGSDTCLVFNFLRKFHSLMILFWWYLVENLLSSHKKLCFGSKLSTIMDSLITQFSEMKKE